MSTVLPPSSLIVDYKLDNTLCIGATSPLNLENFCTKLKIKHAYKSSYKEIVAFLEANQQIQLILFELDENSMALYQRLRHYMLYKRPELAHIPFVIVSAYPSVKWKKLAKRFKATDYLLFPLTEHYTLNRLEALVYKREKTVNSLPANIKWVTPRWKRAIDILGAGLLLLLLSPILVFIAVLIKLESKGPVFYTSKRAGQAYQVFDFYKFRSMRLDADQLLDELMKKNQYATAQAEDAAPMNELRAKPGPGQYTVLVKNDAYIFEEKELEEATKSTFFKMKDDPRITRLGQFLRNTSLDELPQLLNVLKGDLSLVGNRPLPLYEAEQLTQGEAIGRFAAPAGITGLWQVSKRGQKDMSEEERKQLDITYAKEYSFWMDMKILWKTLPAAIQSENV